MKRCGSLRNNNIQIDDLVKCLEVIFPQEKLFDFDYSKGIPP